MHLLPLVAATFFMVSGGPYAIEDILGGAGFARAILILLLLPIIWSLPTALMIGELASAIPADGGFYIWVRRALGPFWGYQEGWLSLSASVFDMAIYPAFAVEYLGKFDPALTAGRRGWMWSLAIVALCCIWNLWGAPAVGDGSVWMSVLLLSPFVVFVTLGFWHGFTLHPAVQWSGPASSTALSTAVLVAMWNYMGWDNASTVAQEVHNPQQVYPRAMIVSTALVTVTYILPLAAMALAGLGVTNFETGDWISAATQIGGAGIGHWLGWAVAAGGVITGVGMFNALVMSYSRLPMAMAEDRMLPRFVARRNSRGVPWVSVILCGLAWALALKLPFEKLITIDIVLYGTSLMLEFVALVVLRLREPALARPFKTGNLACACLLGLGPAALMIYALYASRTDEVKLGGESISALLFSLIVALLGPLLYRFATPRAGRNREIPAPATE
ncbi:APC family permease [Terracidiphilus sp.]|jgi:amino acid transporter|uniref:APC family permease n=1 Tax=Terracidiphilus sp. TaxID=1964191 RepID=UPI003C295703